MANQSGSHERKEAVGANEASLLHQEFLALPATAILPVFVLQEIVDIVVSHAFIILGILGAVSSFFSLGFHPAPKNEDAAPIGCYAPSGKYPTTSCPPSQPRKLKYIGLSTTMFGPDVTLTRTDN